MKIGINLYSLRTFLWSEEQIYQTLAKLKAMGYECVQFSGAAIHPEELQRASFRAEIPVVLTHAAQSKVLFESEAAAKEHAVFGCNRIGIGYMPKEYQGTKAGIERFISDMNAASRRLLSCGAKLYYHNHAFEFEKIEGVCAFDRMLEGFDPEIGVIADTYWLQYAGVSVTDYLEKMKGRIDCIHLKDYVLEGDQPRIGALGDGNIDFPRVVEVAKRCGTEFLLVEQDNAVDFPDPFEEAERSLRHLKQIL